MFAPKVISDKILSLFIPIFLNLVIRRPWNRSLFTEMWRINKKSLYLKKCKFLVRFLLCSYAFSFFQLFWTVGIWRFEKEMESGCR